KSPMGKVQFEQIVKCCALSNLFKKNAFYL
ncbi:MAG: hypothetical protein ACI81T_000124, partial [Bacteroidia bacterium]